MNILVITDVLWRNDNGVGNSYTNIFGGMKNVRIANICCQQGKSQNDVSECCFQISETSLIMNLLNPKKKSGQIEVLNNENNTEEAKTKTKFDIIKKSRLQIFFWIRDLIWKIGRWKSDELRAFIDDFEPDIIFAQLQDKLYQNRLVSYVSEYTQKPLMLYVWDDVYSLKQLSFSPMFWIDRFIQRRSIKGLVKRCSVLYTISKEQKAEYAKAFNKPTKLLYKGKKFDDFPQKTEVNEPIHIIYTGNLYSGRYKTILQFCRDLDDINKFATRAVLDIYSGTFLSKNEEAALNIDGSSRFMGKISESEVQEIQKKADILLHIEPFTLKGSLLCRLSFSTKLVDYFNKQKCIFAVGSSRCSSMKYLKRYDAAITAESYNKMREKLSELISNPQIIKEYADKAWKCGAKNHSIEDIQSRLYKDFEEAINESCAD